MTNIEVGDKVRFLNEVGQGKVTRIQGNIVYVYTEEGFEIPVNAKQLVVIEKNTQASPKVFFNDAETMNYNYAEREVDNFYPILEQSEPYTDDFYLAFVREENLKEDELNLYLINDSKNDFTFCLFCRKLNNHEFIDTAHLESGAKLFIKTLSKEEIAQISFYTVQGVIFNISENKVGKILNKELKINAIYLLNINYFNENDFFEEPAFILSILQSEKNQQQIKQLKIEEDIKEKTPLSTKKIIEKAELMEVDLHIPSLIDEYKNLTPTEMLQIQINYFRKKMEECILNSSIKKVVFIHGVGNGTLKIELRRILSREYSHYDYQDASYQEYGFGATMVILRK